jgi:hypothetical protein
MKNLDLTCPLCGERKAKHNGRKFIEKEHIPPRCVLEPSLERKELITVPSCEECNSRTSEFDEKFKVQLSIWLGIDTRDKEILWNKVRRTLKQKKGWRNEIIENTSYPLLVPYAKGYGHQVRLDANILKTASRKILRGLHWHVTQEILPPDMQPEIILAEQGKKFDQHYQDTFTKYGKTIIKCGGQFEAIHAIPEDVYHASIWLLRFYGDDFLLAFLMPKEPIFKNTGTFAVAPTPS